MDQPIANETPDHSTRKLRFNVPPLVLIGGAVVFVVVALLIGLQLFRVLSVMVFPPGAPLPPETTEINSQNLAHGVDQFTYTSAASPCEVVQFYTDTGSDCMVQGALCTGSEYNSPGYSLPEVATCIGTDEVSVFGRRWDVLIYTRMIGGVETTYFDVQRDVLWSGPAPQATSTPLD